MDVKRVSTIYMLIRNLENGKDIYKILGHIYKILHLYSKCCGGLDNYWIVKRFSNVCQMLVASNILKDGVLFEAD